jgi:hypothetical protein
VAPGPARGAERLTLRGVVRRRRLAAAQGALAVVLPLAVVGVLLAAPHDLAAVRFGGVGLAWWAAGAAGGVTLAVLAVGARADDRRPRRPD